MGSSVAMTKKTDVIESAGAFRDQLSHLANDGHFSEAEREGFRLLHLFYSDRLASFQIGARYGEESEFYENPKYWSDVGHRVAPAAKAGDVASQQPVYDAANGGGDALEAVTGSASRFNPASVIGGLTNLPTGLTGALLTKRGDY